MERECVVFKVASDIGHFRRQYAITTALTYAIPPRTALCGLLGAVLGLAKNESLSLFRDDAALFGLQILHPVRTSTISINLLDTKDNRDFRPKSVNPHTAMRYEVLQQPCYRVMFSHSDLTPKVYQALSHGESIYTPCLGLAWMIAWFENDPLLAKARHISDSREPQHFVSPIRTSDLVGSVEWHADGVYQRVRMPAEMLPDRRVTRYEQYIVDTTGGAITASLRSFWKLTDGTCFSAL